MYVFDNDSFPYGNKDDLFILKRIINIIETISKKYLISLAVIACNTASIIALIELRKYHLFPIIGLVPAIKPSVQITRNGIIGLLATHNTIYSNIVSDLISKFAGKCKILAIESSKLVILAEEKFIGKKIFLEDLRCILKPWLNNFKTPDTIILGCTHFVLLRDELKKIFPLNTYLVDSGIAIAYRVNWLLKYKKIKLGYLKENIAYCTSLNKKSNQLSRVFRDYGFPILKQLILN
nr:glutamate racemase [Candidatus Pantoea edessiphila]